MAPSTRGAAGRQTCDISVARRVTLVYAVCHLVVDLASITTLMGCVSATLRPLDAQVTVGAIIGYDLVAFCLQLPVGTLLDALGRRASRVATLLSFALVATGVLLGMVGQVMVSMAAVAFVGLGNALFHGAGGIEVLFESDGRMAPAGEYISTGALGVFVGGLSAFNGWALAPQALLVLLAACAVLVSRACGAASGETGALSLSLPAAGWLAVILLAVTVALRSYAGSVMAFPWKADIQLAALLVCAVVAGKACGGRVADAIGAPLASALSLGASAPLFCLSWESVAAGLVATFLFNFTMAITLCSLERLLPEAKGTAFGIASFALIVGALPALLGDRVGSGPVLCVLSLASLVTLAAGLFLVARLRPSRERREGGVPGPVGRVSSHG